VIAASLVLGCRGTDAEDDGPDPGGPTAGETEGGVPCESSSDCPDGESCVAPYEGKGGPEDFVCVAECVEAQVDEQWCADDEACCGDLRCGRLGFCFGASDDTTGG
jgi:hypothetical protein